MDRQLDREIEIHSILGSELYHIHTIYMQHVHARVRQNSRKNGSDDS
jgi:hypothetical protein